MSNTSRINLQELKYDIELLVEKYAMLGIDRAVVGLCDGGTGNLLIVPSNNLDSLSMRDIADYMIYNAIKQDTADNKQTDYFDNKRN